MFLTVLYGLIRWFCGQWLNNDTFVSKNQSQSYSLRNMLLVMFNAALQKVSPEPAYNVLTKKCCCRQYSYTLNFA
jgi:hypothetical protein